MVAEQLPLPDTHDWEFCGTVDPLFAARAAAAQCERTAVLFRASMRDVIAELLRRQDAGEYDHERCL